MIKDELPHRFRELSFRFYEPYIAQVVRAFPQPITIRPSTVNLSPITFACRFRDAIKSLAKYKWGTTEVNMDKFLTCYEQIGVSEGGNAGVLTIGDKKNLKKTSEGLVNASAIVSTLNQNDGKIYTLTSESQLAMVCALASDRALSYTITCYPVTKEQKTKYELEYDVSIELDEKTGIASIL